MRSYYSLTHQRVDGTGFDEKHIGIFTDMGKLLKVIENYKTLPGFKDFPDGFYVTAFKLNCDYFHEEITHNFKKDYVWVLSHGYNDEDDNEIGTFFGVYSSLNRAKNSLKMYMELPKFKRHPQGFYINKYILNQSEWQEGFVTYYY
ncbi:hypothetical protein ACJ2A9_09610 [Anaerobacillus sp. MEB173]|uniref:hypothetical protein n=1 Tax=Anaerobacillus sp. MEB173 TaxID=3383345 RepID=UPI003F92088D